MLGPALICAAVSAAGALAAFRALLRKPPSGLEVTNFRGIRIHAIGGITILCGILAGAGCLVALALAGSHSSRRVLHSGELAGLAMVALGFFALGLLDDSGLGTARGLRGHLAALRRGEITGGVIKAGGGGVAGLLAASAWSSGAGAVLGSAVLIALSANFVNLLDLRPGRAAKAFLIGWAGILAAGGHGFAAMSSPAAAACAVWLPGDLQERGVLGDSGSNLLGGLAGSGLALTLGGGGRLAAIGVLAALTLASERWSFTAFIERVRPLRWLDSIGRPAQES